VPCSRIGRKVQTRSTPAHRGENPGLKQDNPRAISPRDKKTSLLWWRPAMRAHPTWQRPLDVHISFFFTPFPPLDKHLACYMLLPSVTSDLLDLIIIDISSNNYQHKSRRPSSREVEQTVSTHLPDTTPRPPRRQLETAGNNQIRLEASDQQQI